MVTARTFSPMFARSTLDSLVAAQVEATRRSDLASDLMKTIDRNGDVLLDVGELDQALAAGDLNERLATAARGLRETLENASGPMDFEGVARAIAQLDVPPDESGDPAKERARALNALDENGDGVLTQTEIEGAAQRLRTVDPSLSDTGRIAAAIRSLDTDGDEGLSLGELDRALDLRRSEVALLDADKDGRLTDAEWSSGLAAGSRLFGLADKDGDRRLTSREWETFLGSADG